MKFNSTHSSNNGNKNSSSSSDCGMNEIDTETHVVWPSWCYAGDTPSNDDASTFVRNLTSSTSLHHSSSLSKQLKSASIAASLNALAAASAAANSQAQKFKGKRKLISGNHSSSISNAVDKMLSDRLNLADNKKHCDMSNRTSSPIPSNNLTENSNGNSEEATDLSESKGISASAMDYFKTTPNNGDTFSTTINNNKLITNNNANIKNERFSPPQQMQSQSTAQSNGANADAHSSNSRSRSVTPSSHPGTPPQHQQNDLLAATNFSTSLANSLTSGQMKPEFATGRTYSDQLRNFAAKYNALNESNSVRNSLFDSRYNISPMKTGITKDMTSPENLKRTNTTVPSPISNTANNLISTLFSTFPPTAFPSLIDMRGSQLLLSLAQAAKDSELKQQILNGPQKRMTKRQTPPIHPLRSQQSPPSNSTTSPQNRIPLPASIPSTFQLLSLQQKANSLLSNQPFLASSPSISQTLATTSNSSTRARPSSPLDLSASTPVGGKRLKIESTSPSRRTASPSPTTIQHTKTSCGSSENSASDTSSTQIQRRCHAQTDEINSWTVDQVCSFVASIDICAEYVENFREQCIDGSGLPLLTEDHLMHSLNMKLGPALKLRSVLLKRLGGPCPCVSCNSSTSNANNSVVASNSAPSPLNSGRPSSTGSDDRFVSTKTSHEFDVGVSIQIKVDIGNFREQCIDGSGLPLLTEDHLMHSLNMKLGPALKLRSVLLKRLGGPCPCVSCNSSTSNANNSVVASNSAPSPLNSGRPSSTGSGT